MTMRSLIPLIVAFVILLVALGLYGFGYYTLASDTQKAATLATQINLKSQQLDRLARAHTALATLANDEATLRQYSVGKEEVVPFLETLQATGRPLGAGVQVLSVANEKSGTHNRISLSLSITGSFDAVMRTLGAIEYGPYDGVVTSLSLETVPSAGKGGNTWTAATMYSVGLRSASTTNPLATTTQSKP
jgi:Tfp pilus assembly protein PilN